MTGKITLISPPDVYVNRGFSIILVNTTEEEQEKNRQHLGDHPGGRDVRIEGMSE